MTDNAANGQAPAQPQLSVQKLYVKDSSFEAPAAPHIFQEQGQPQIQLQLGQQVNALAPEVFEVVLSVTVTCKLGEKTAYLCEVQQAGIFGVAGFDDANRDAVLGSYCPNVLFRMRARPFPTWSRAAASRRSSCSRSTSTRCMPKPWLAAPKAAPTRRR